MGLFFSSSSPSLLFVSLARRIQSRDVESGGADGQKNGNDLATCHSYKVTFISQVSCRGRGPWKMEVKGEEREKGVLVWLG